MPRSVIQSVGFLRHAGVRLAFLVGTLTLACFSDAAAGVACGFTQLTDSLQDGRAIELVGVSGDGEEAMFITSAESGMGGTGMELLRVAADGRFPSFSGVLQVSIDGLIPDSLAASDDLARVIFRSDRNPTGDNPDGGTELFLLNTETGRTSQLTSGGARDSVFTAQISGDGNAVVYVSNADPLDENSDGSREVFWRSLAPPAFLQLTHLSAVSVPHNVSMSHDGRRVAFQVRQTLIGLTDLQILDLNADASQLVLTAARLPRSFMTRNGDRLLVATDADLTGSNRDGSLEIFEIDLAPQAEQRLRQVTDFGVSDGLAFEPLDFSGNGRFVAFRSALDLQGWPAGGAANLFLLDVSDGSISQVTHWTAPQRDEGRVELNASGDRILVSSRNNLISGARRGGQQAFLIGCEPASVRYVSQVGNGFAGILKFATSFVLSNTGRNGSVRLDFFDQQGKPMGLPLTGVGTRSSLFFPVQSGTPLLLSTSGQGPIQSGYARIVSSPGVTGNGVFTGARRPATILYEAAVPFSEPMTDFSVVVNTRDSFLTGLALVNPSSMFSREDDGVASVVLRLYDEHFDLLIEKPLELAVGQHQAQFIDLTFEEVVGIEDFVGTLTVSSSRPLAAIALRQHDDPRIDFPFEVPTLTTLTVAPGRADQ